MNENLTTLMEELDRLAEPCDENKISNRVDKASEGDDSFEAIAERLAFKFIENCDSRDMGWGTYFGPLATWQDASGKVHTNPALSQIDSAVLSYWAMRAENTANQVLTARYAGLVWDLTKLAVGERPEYRIAVLHVEALIKVVSNRLFAHPVDAINKIGRAYRVAKSLNRDQLVRCAIVEAIALEDEVADDESPGLFGFCFDEFLLGKEHHLLKSEARKLIDDLWGRLDRLSEKGSPWSAESAGLALAKYFRSQGDADRARAVLEQVGAVFEAACENVPPIQAISWYQHVYKLYKSCNLNDAANRVAIKITDVGPRVLENMYSASHEMKVPQDELDRFCDALTEGSLDKSLERIAMYFCPSRDKVENQVLKLAQDYPITFLFTKTLQDQRGRPIATIGSIEDDLEGNVVHQLSQNLQINSFFLRSALNRLTERYEVTAQNLTEHLFRSPLFVSPQLNLVLVGIKRFLENDHSSAIHILVPQIEAALRTLCELTGVATLRENRYGGMQLRSLGELLSESTVSQCFGSDATFYMRMLLADERGWNVRNNVCHGISPATTFSHPIADRVLHILLVLARAREANE